jgi:hypothetical protein
MKKIFYEEGRKAGERQEEGWENDDRFAKGFRFGGIRHSSFLSCFPFLSSCLPYKIVSKFLRDVAFLI